MPTLTRFIIVIFIFAALIYGGMLGLVAWVKPVTSDMTIHIAPSELNIRPWPNKTTTLPEEQNTDSDHQAESHTP